MKIRAFIAALALSTVVVSGCATEESSKTDEPKSGSNAAPMDDDTATDEPAAEETTEAPAANPTFGEAVTYPNGIQVTVGKPKDFKPGEYAAMTNEWPAYRSFDVVVLNGSQENFDASMMYFSMQSGDEEAEEVFDSENGFEGTPTTKVLPGRQSKFKVGFGIKDPKDMVMEVNTGDFESEATIYTN